MFKLLGLTSASLILMLRMPMAQEVAPPSQSAGGMSDITVLSVDIGHFQYGNKIIHVFENSRNKAQFPSSPEKWGFMIEPLMTPKSGAGALLTKIFEMDPTCRPGSKEKVKNRRVLVPLDTITDIAVDKSIAIIHARYPEAKCRVGPQNVDVLPITSLSLSIPDIEEKGGEMYHSTSIHTKELKYLTSPAVINLGFDVWEKKSVDTDIQLKKFSSFLPFMAVEASMSFSVKSTRFNLTSVVAEKLKDTDLFVKLVGEGGETIVQRDDLRKLTQQAARQLSAIAIVEDPENFDQDLFDKIIADSKVITADEEFFNNMQGKSTYNVDDLRPTILSQKLNKLFDYDQGKWFKKSSGSASGGGSFFDIVEAEAAASYATEELNEFLKQHYVESDLKGEIIVVKSIQLQAVNISKFVSNSSFTSEYRNIESGPKSGLKTVVYMDVPTVTPGPTFEQLTADCAKPEETLKILNIR